MRILKNKKNSSSNGFTLIELLVTIVILSVLIVVVFIVFNPVDQLNKARDAQRRQDFVQIRNALDAFYNDHNYYPQPSDFTFGGSWVDPTNGIIYMKKVPQDPDCYNTGYCYLYQTDTSSSTPQWNVLYARLSKSITKMTAEEKKTNCPLSIVCGQQSAKYTYCVPSGEVSCSYIAGNPLPGPVIPNTPTPTAQLPTATPTTAPGVDCSIDNKYYANVGGCNSINPSSQCNIFPGGNPNYTCYHSPSCTGAKCNK
jgi:prepilin-type N-terminal cleavage/methylation domain-containing protein